MSIQIPIRDRERGLRGPGLSSSDVAQLDAKVAAAQNAASQADTDAARAEDAADLAQATTAQMIVTTTLLRANTSLPATGATPTNTIILGTRIPRDGRLKKVRVRFNSAGAVDIRVFNRLGGTGQIAAGDAFEQADAVTVNGTGNGWHTFNVDVPVSEGQYLGFYAASALVQINPAPPAVGDRFGTAAVSGDYSSVTLSVAIADRQFLIGFDIVSDVLTAAAFDDHTQRIEDLERITPFYVPSSEQLPSPSSGKIGVVGRDGAVYSDGVSWYKMGDDSPYGVLWSQIAGLATKDGWSGVYDPGDIHRRVLVDDQVSNLTDAMGRFAPLSAVIGRPVISSIGNLPAMSMGDGQATTLKAPTITPQVDAPYAIMFVAEVDDPSVNQFLIDGVVAPDRIAFFINNGDYHLLATSADWDTTIPAQAGKHIWTLVVTTESEEVWRNNSRLYRVGGSSSPRPFKGITYGDRFAPDGRFLRGQLGPALIYDGELSDAARLRMTKVLAGAAGIPIPGYSASSQSAIVMDADEVHFEQDADTRTDVASIGKLMTLLTAWDAATNLNETVQIRAEDIISNPDNSPLLEDGDLVSLRDLLYMLSLTSSNNASMAIARHLGGSMAGAGTPVSRFGDAMDAKAISLGLVGSDWSFPYQALSASARDCAVVALAVADTPGASAISSAQSWMVDVDGPNPRTLELKSSSFGIWRSSLRAAKTGTSSNLFSMATVFEVGGKNTAVVAIRNATPAGRLDDINGMLDRRIWDVTQP